MPETDQPSPSPPPQRGRVRQSAGILDVGSGLFPTAPGLADRFPGLLPAAEAVVPIRRRPSRQDRERLATLPTPPTPYPDPVLPRVMGLLAPLPVTDDRFLPAQRTPARQLLQTDGGYPGSALSSAPANAIKRITTAVEAGRRFFPPGSIRWPTFTLPSRSLSNEKRILSSPDQ